MTLSIFIFNIISLEYFYTVRHILIIFKKKLPSDNSLFLDHINIIYNYISYLTLFDVFLDLCQFFPKLSLQAGVEISAGHSRYFVDFRGIVGGARESWTWNYFIDFYQLLKN